MNNYQVVVPISTVRDSPSSGATCTSEALYGETVSLLESHGEWMHVSQHHDNYRGFINKQDLKAVPTSGTGCETDTHAPTHWVKQSSTLLFKKPDLKSEIAHRIYFASELHLISIENTSFSQNSCGHFVWTEHCNSIDKTTSLDPITLAKSHFLGMPYVWGGRSSAGADCSGLIQLLARSQGLRIPRDSGDQEAFIKSVVPMDKRQTLDIVYWPGHTGMLLDANTLLHATAYKLSCVIEPLSDVTNRAGSPSSIRRLFQ